MSKLKKKCIADKKKTQEIIIIVIINYNNNIIYIYKSDYTIYNWGKIINDIWFFMIFVTLNAQI